MCILIRIWPACKMPSNPSDFLHTQRDFFQQICWQYAGNQQKSYIGTRRKNPFIMRFLRLEKDHFFDYESKGRGFESLRARQKNRFVKWFFFFHFWKPRNFVSNTLTTLCRSTPLYIAFCLQQRSILHFRKFPDLKSTLYSAFPSAVALPGQPAYPLRVPRKTASFQSVSKPGAADGPMHWPKRATGPLGEERAAHRNKKRSLMAWLAAFLPCLTGYLMVLFL